MGPARLPGAQDPLVLTDVETPPPCPKNPAMVSAAPTDLDVTWSGSGLRSLEDLIPAGGDVLILRTKCICVPSFSMRPDHPHATSRLHSCDTPAGADGTSVATATPGPRGQRRPGRRQ